MKKFFVFLLFAILVCLAGSCLSVYASECTLFFVNGCDGRTQAIDHCLNFCQFTAIDNFLRDRGRSISSPGYGSGNRIKPIR